MPKKNFMTLTAIFGCQIAIFCRAFDRKSRNWPILGLFSTFNLSKSWNMALKYFMHLLWTLKKTKEKNFWCKKFSRYLNFKKKKFYDCSWRKMLSFPPLTFTNLDEIFTGGTSHHGLPPVKISSKSEHFKCQKLCSKIKNWKKKTSKIVFKPETLP